MAHLFAVMLSRIKKKRRQIHSVSPIYRDDPVKVALCLKPQVALQNHLTLPNKGMGMIVDSVKGQTLFCGFNGIHRSRAYTV